MPIIGFTGKNNNDIHNALKKYLQKQKDKIRPFKKTEQLIDSVATGGIQKAILLMGDTLHGRAEKNFDFLYKNHLFVNNAIKIPAKNKSIQNYYIISKNPDVPEKKGNKNYHTLIAITPHHDRPGLLRDLSSIISIYNVNMTDIFSRPAIEPGSAKRDAKMFYIIMEGHIMSDTFQTHILEGIKSILQHSDSHNSFRFMGCYEVNE